MIDTTIMNSELSTTCVVYSSVSSSLSASFGPITADKILHVTVPDIPYICQGQILQYQKTPNYNGLSKTGCNFFSCEIQRLEPCLHHYSVFPKMWFFILLAQDGSIFILESRMGKRMKSKWQTMSTDYFCKKSLFPGTTKDTSVYFSLNKTQSQSLMKLQRSLGKCNSLLQETIAQIKVSGTRGKKDTGATQLCMNI